MSAEVKLTDAQAWEITRAVMQLGRAKLGLLHLEQQEPSGLVTVTLRRLDGLDDSFLLTANGERLARLPRAPREDAPLRGRTYGTRRAHR